MSYFPLLCCSQGVATAGSAAHVIWQIFTLDGLPDTALEGFVSASRIEPGIFGLLQRGATFPDRS